jgi:hypothetical protein
MGESDNRQRCVRFGNGMREQKMRPNLTRLKVSTLLFVPYSSCSECDVLFSALEFSDF